MSGLIALSLCPVPQATRLEFAGASGTNRSVMRVELGSIDPISRPIVEQSFTLTNRSQSAVRIVRIESTCGCTNATLDGSGADAGPLEIAPGRSAELRATHQLFLIRPGQMKKYIWLYAEGRKEPAATVEIALNLRAGVRFEPANLDFGTLQAGRSKELRIEAQIDARLAPLTGRPGPILPVCSDPDVRIVEVRPGRRPNALRGWVRRAYLLTVSPRASIGAHVAALSFPPDSGTSSTVDPNVLILAQGLATARFVVEGRISATPAVAAFGVVDPGKEHRLRLPLAGKDRTALRGLSVMSGAPWLDATVIASSHPRRATLELTLAGSAPYGPQETQVQLTTADGQRLVVPVKALIQPRSK
jgi:hypothetical protein